MSVLLALLALLAERLFGYPDRLFRLVGHPVTWIGRLIGALDKGWNNGGHASRAAGVAALLLIVLVPVAIGVVLQFVLGGTVVGLLVLALLASALLAQKSLGEHVEAVARGLETGGLEEGRKAVSMIVGRDPEALDEAGVSRAAIESLAENFSDGITAPAVWMALGGLPGALAYKAVNTADSMIGHLSPRHRRFGWAAARLDDLMNLPASRLTALLLVAAAAIVPNASPGGALRAVWRDASKHRSPNAGWPEAAMAGALGLALAGPRAYAGVMTEDGVMGEGGRREATAHDIRGALRLYWTADALLLALFGLIATALFIAHGG